MSLASFIKEQALALGFQAVGIAAAADFRETEGLILQRIDAGRLDGLPWFTKDRARLACRPEELLPGARSIIALGASYHQPEPEAGDGYGPRGRVARYAWGQDYHKTLRRRASELLDAISRELGYSPGARVFVDSSPLAERAVAQRAGLGWFGKNTNILTHGVGSWTLLVSIIVDIDLPPDEPLRTHCGSCTRCIDACPTGALVEPYVLDNTRCISYQTIENRGAIPRDLRPLVGDWVFGCDICQDVCPVNRRPADALMPEFAPKHADAVRPVLTDLLQMDVAGYEQRFGGRAVTRAKRTGLRRNAAVALGNAGDEGAVPALVAALRDEEPLVRSHAAWALGRIGGDAAERALRDALLDEPSPAVRDELQAALGGT